MNEETAGHNIPAWVFLLPAIMSLLALADLPYGYYQLLRIVVTGSAAWIAYAYNNRRIMIGAIVFVGIAVIFNPIAKIHMERNVHAVFNLITFAIFAIGFYFERRRIK